MKYIRALGAVLALSSISSAAYAETDPHDYTGLAGAPNNTVVAWGYARAISTSDSQNLSQALGIMRATYVLKFGDLHVVPIDVLVPMAHVTVYEAPMMQPSLFRAQGILEHVSGLADLEYFPTVSYTVPEGEGTNTLVAATVYVTAPTGMYDQTKLVNIGNHRWAFQPQIALAQTISKSFTAEAVGYGVFHTDNSAFQPPAMLPLQALKMDPTWGADVHVAYAPNATGFFALSYYVAANGKSFFTPTAGGMVVASDVITTPQQTVQTLRFSFGWDVEKATLILFQFNQDIAASGPGATISNFIGMRLNHAFVL